MAQTCQAVRDIIEWDVQSWRQALPFWEKCIGEAHGLRVLDVGARNGGLSLYWALRGCRVVCSDRDGASSAAYRLHERYGVTSQMEYAQADATRLPFGDGEFDIVSFKSVLGGIGGALGWEGQKSAVREMHRVLRPGGRLAFAENLAASPLHRFLRTRFIRWGGRWRYISSVEIPELFGDFTDLRLAFRGVLATFGRREWQRSVLHMLDAAVLDRVVPARYRYIVFGCATR